MKILPNAYRAVPVFAIIGILSILSPNMAQAASPVANSSSATLNEDAASKTLNLSATDADRGDTLTYNIARQPTKGTLSQTTVGSRTFIYRPNTNENGADSFDFQATDLSGNVSNTATVSLSITPINDRPVPTAGITSLTTEDTAVIVTLSGSDVDGDALTYSAYGTASHGTVSIDGSTGLATFTPSANYNGSASFKFKVADGTTTSASYATVTVSISAVDDLPAATSATRSVNEDATSTITLSASDPDGAALTYTIVSTASHATTFSLVGNRLSYKGAANYNGSDSFTFQAYETANPANVSNVATVSITVNPVNDTPTATAFTAPATDEDVATIIDLTSHASDIDGDTLNYYATTSTSKGTVVIDATSGMATFTPSANLNGTGYFYFYARDPAGRTSSSVKVTVSITAINDSPTATDQSVNGTEDTSSAIALTASDVEADALTYQITSSPTHGTLNLVGSSVMYTPENNENGSDSFTFQVYETANPTNVSNTATVTVNIAAVNDAPTAEDVSASTTASQSVTLDLQASDVDGDILTYEFVPLNGTVALQDTSYVYTPNEEFVGTDDFSYTVSDGTLSDTADVQISVNPAPVAPPSEDPEEPVNTAPTYGSSNALLLLTQIEVAVSDTLEASDAEGDAITYAIASLPAHGTITLDGALLTYTPEENFSGLDTLTVTMSDVHGASAILTVSIDVTSDCTYVRNDVTDTSGRITYIAAKNINGTETNYNYPIRRAQVSATLSDDPNDDGGFGGSDTTVTTATDDNGCYLIPHQEGYVVSSVTVTAHSDSSLSIYNGQSVNTPDGIAPDTCNGATWYFSADNGLTDYSQTLTVSDPAVGDVIDIAISDAEQVQGFMTIDVLIQAAEMTCESDAAITLPELEPTITSLTNELNAGGYIPGLETMTLSTDSDDAYFRGSIGHEFCHYLQDHFYPNAMRDNLILRTRAALSLTLPNGHDNFYDEDPRVAWIEGSCDGIGNYIAYELSGIYSLDITSLSGTIMYGDGIKSERNVAYVIANLLQQNGYATFHSVNANDMGETEAFQTLHAFLYYYQQRGASIGSYVEDIIPLSSLSDLYDTSNALGRLNGSGHALYPTILAAAYGKYISYEPTSGYDCPSDIDGPESLMAWFECEDRAIGGNGDLTGPMSTFLRTALSSYWYPEGDTWVQWRYFSALNDEPADVYWNDVATDYEILADAGNFTLPLSESHEARAHDTLNFSPQYDGPALFSGNANRWFLVDGDAYTTQEEYDEFTANPSFSGVYATEIPVFRIGDDSSDCSSITLNVEVYYQGALYASASGHCPQIENMPQGPAIVEIWADPEQGEVGCFAFMDEAFCEY